MPRLWQGLMALGIGLGASVSVAAQSLQLAPYEHAEVVDSSERFQADYRLTLGSMKKANSQWFAEREQRLAGPVSRQTLQVSDGYSAEDAFRFYRRQLLDMRARELFHCEERDCGSSNSWANERFGVRQLYGLDQEQWYSAFELDAADSIGGSHFVAVYAVTRGNKRSYVHVEQIWDARGAHLAASPKTILEALASGQAYHIPDLSISGDEVSLPRHQLEALVAALGLNPRLNVYLVGHDYSGASLEQQRARSLRYAQSLQGLLVGEGVASGRLKAEGVGGLAPGYRAGHQNRVEVVAAQ